MNTIPKTVQDADKYWSIIDAILNKKVLFISQFKVFTGMFGETESISNFMHYSDKFIENSNTNCVFRVYHKGKNPMNQKLK
jgi:hypothetical protein